MKFLVVALSLVAAASARPDVSSLSGSYLPGSVGGGSSILSTGYQNGGGFDNGFGGIGGGGIGGIGIGGIGGIGGHGGGYQQDQKHVYFYAAPDDEQAARLRIQIAPSSQRNTKIIFVKAPSYGGVIPEVIAPPSHAEDKTLVYVLVKKPEHPGPITIPASATVKQAKPEVYFIKYRNQHDAEQAVLGGLNGQSVGNSLPNLGDQGSFVRTLDAGRIGGGGGGIFLGGGGGGLGGDISGSSILGTTSGGGGGITSIGGGGGLGVTGGWYVLRNWNLENFDPNDILKQLHVKYGVSPYFKVSVQPNPHVPGANSITISPAGLGLPDRSYYYRNQDDPILRSYKQMIKDTVINLSVTKTEAEKFAEDMFFYEKRIAEITPHSYDMLNPVNTYNLRKISELKLTVASLPLQDILTSMFPESNVTEETEVIVTSPDYLTKVSQTVAASDRTTLNGYVVWTLARKYLPYLSAQFTSMVESFHSELFGIQEPLQRWEKCSHVVQKFMGLAVQSTFELQNPISNKTRTAVESIFQEIRKAVEERIKKYQVSSQLSKYLSIKISKMKLQIGLPEITKKYNYVKQFYTKLIVLKANLFESLKNGLIFQRKIEERLLLAPHLQDKLIHYATSDPLQVSYSAALNTVVVPRAVLSEFVFEDLYPSSVQYGRLGVSIANAIISSILPYENAWTADLKLLSPFHFTVNESHLAIANASNCLSHFIINNRLVSENVITTDQSATKSIAELTSLSMLKHLSAISSAHQAFINSLKDTVHTHQPSLEAYEDSALFFLAYAQTQCSTSTKPQELFDNYVNYELTQKSQLEVVWSQIPEFSAALECGLHKNERCSDIL